MWQIDVSVEVEFVPEKVDLDDALLEEFKSVFEKFSFRDSAAGEVGMGTPLGWIFFFFCLIGGYFSLILIVFFCRMMGRRMT